MSRATSAEYIVLHVIFDKRIATQSNWQSNWKSIFLARCQDLLGIFGIVKKENTSKKIGIPDSRQSEFNTKYLEFPVEQFGDGFPLPTLGNIL